MWLSVSSKIVSFRLKSSQNFISKLLLSFVRMELTWLSPDSTICDLGDISKNKNTTVYIFVNFHDSLISYSKVSFIVSTSIENYGAVINQGCGYRFSVFYP